MKGIVRLACCSRSQRKDGRDPSSHKSDNKVFASTSFSGSLVIPVAAIGSLTCLISLFELFTNFSSADFRLFFHLKLPTNSPYGRGEIPPF